MIRKLAVKTMIDSTTVDGYDIFYELETGPFDWLELFCPLEQAGAIIAEQSKHCAHGNHDPVQRLVEVANADRKKFSGSWCSGLREPPRVLFLPDMGGYRTVLLCKEDNNGTCHWYSEDAFVLKVIAILMDEDER